jgi:hypothetical protein
MISIITVTKRREGYKSMVESIEKQTGGLVDRYIAFTNNLQTHDAYKAIEAENSKVKIFYGKENFIYKSGFDTVYNFLHTKVPPENWIFVAVDVDNIEINKEQLEKDIATDPDMMSIQMYMQRGNVWETKNLFYKANNLFQWHGLVHEIMNFNRQPKIIPTTAIKIIHNNALDKTSQEIKKSQDGFPILEKAEEGSDSEKRNLLYESLVYRIVNEGGRHAHKQWYDRYYQINKEVIDYYNEKAKEYFK